MMGFGAMGMASWILGAIALTTIWGGLCWVLAVVGHRTAQPQPGLPTGLAGDEPPLTAGWQQPAFGPPPVLGPLTTDQPPQGAPAIPSGSELR